MNYVLHVVIIIGILALVGFVVYSNSSEVQKNVNELEEIAMKNLGKITEVNDAGDIIDIFKGEPTVVQETTFVNESTGQELTQEEFIAKQESLGNTITEEDIIQMSIEGGVSYGYTTKFDLKELPDSTYQIGNPVLFSGKMKKVIEGSCGLNQDTQVIECDYVDPSTFSYTFYITCEYRDFCSLSTITRPGEMTNNDGTWTQKIQTSLSTLPVGEYKMQIEANSLVDNPSTSRPYLISAEKVFHLVK